MLQIELQEADGRCINRELDLGKHTLGRSLFADVRVKDKALEKLHLSIEVMTEEVVITALKGADFSVAGELQQRLINPSPQTLLRLGKSEIKIIDTPAAGINPSVAPVKTVASKPLIQTPREANAPVQAVAETAAQPQQPKPVAAVPELARLDSQTAVAPHIWTELKNSYSKNHGKAGSVPAFSGG
ncbi:hypothetical protein [Aliamphritea spongicola]|nr:hypothetical protein [Aliamphritea spongicola]